MPEGQRSCRLNKRASGERVKALRTARALGVLPPPPVVPSTPSILIIRVAFTDQPMTANLAATQSLFADVRAYYEENSYETFHPTFTITNIYTPGPRATYGADCGNDIVCNTPGLFTASTMAAAADGFVFSDHDYIMLYHSGPGQEVTQDSNDIWSVFMDDLDVVAGGQTFPGYTVVPENEAGAAHPHGVITHEFGHQLGLPDLYDVRTQESPLGRWDLMDYPYGNTPEETPHFGAWSKYFLGFSAPVPSPGAFSLAPANRSTSGDQIIRLPHPSANVTFFVEYRWTGDAAPTARFDAGLPSGAGVALWRVDEDLVLGSGSYMENNTVNSPYYNGLGHRGVDLIEADGVEGNGTGDLFGNGTTAGSELTASYGGGPSGLVVSVVSGAATPSLVLNVLTFDTAPLLSISRLINYPNPGGDPSRYPVRPGAPAGTVTTLVIHFTKPPASTSQIEMDIYDLEGRRVRSLPGIAFTQKAGAGEPTRDLKWVYEHDWNGKDESGADVASGVYFYRVKAEGQVKTGKLALIR